MQTGMYSNWFFCRDLLRTIGFFTNKKMLGATLICSAMQIAAIAFPSLNRVFGTVTLNGAQWLAVAALSLLPLTVFEIEKTAKSIKLRRGRSGERLKLSGSNTAA